MPDLELALEYCSDVAVAIDLLLSHVKLRRSDELELLLLTKALRARLFFLGAIELARKEYAAPASALIRCLMEVQYVVEALRKDSRWISDLIASDERQRKLAMERLLRLPPEDRAASVRDERIGAALATIDVSASSVSIREWATRAGRLQEYELAYMLLSNDVHASLRGAESHAVLNESGDLQSLTATPGVRRLPFRLVSASDAILAIFWALPDGVVDAAARTRIEPLAADARRHGINQRALAAVEASADN